MLDGWVKINLNLSFYAGKTWDFVDQDVLGMCTCSCLITNYSIINSFLLSVH